MVKMKNYGECPDCGQSKIYLSQANMLVCGNKKCGRIFEPASSELVLKMEQLIKTYEKALEPIFNQIKIE